MNRKDFMERLEKLLLDIPIEERVEAMAFYHSYFEDAGEENEERVIRELESPEKVAASIKADMNLEPAREEVEENRAEEYTLVKSVKAEDTQKEGYSKGEGHTQTDSYATGDGYRGRQKKDDNTLKIVLIVIVAVLTSPIWLGLLGGLFGLIVGALGTIFGVAVAIVAVVFAFYVAGIALCGASIAAFGCGAAGIGFGLFGAGLLILCFAVLGTILCVWVFGKFVPWAVTGIIALCKKLFGKVKKGGYAS